MGVVPRVLPGRMDCAVAGFGQLSADILRAGKALRFRAGGDSMAPLVRDGDVLLVCPVERQSVRVGDVVLCGLGRERVVVHRVIRKEAGRYGSVRVTVQGDALLEPDAEIPAEQVYGRLVSVERSDAPIEYMDMNGPLMRLLGQLAVARSRWNVGRGKWFGPMRRLLKKVPIVSGYLAYHGSQ